MADEKYDVDAFSHVVDLSTYDTEGFLASFEDQSFELRRTNPEVEAYCTAGTDDLRIDWETYIGPVQEFGSRNDDDGHWCGLCLPLILPERHYMVAYIFEYAFYHDTILESVAAAVKEADSQTLFMDNTSSRSRRAIQGAKQLQSKIFVGFLQGDKERVARIVRTWEKMTSTTAKREKTELFKDILEYEEYRMVDTGAFYVEAVMLWGMGLTLTPEEDAQLEEIRRPCYAALGLTNDYYSFDVEYDGYLKSEGVGSLTNAVWLYMQWEKCDVATAKELTRIEVNRLERDFLRLKRNFEQGPLGVNKKLVYYVRALSFQIPGNLIWSLKCPRYNVSYREVGPLGEMARPEGHGVDVYPEVEELPAVEQVHEVARSDSESDDGQSTSVDSPILRPVSPASSTTTFNEGLEPVPEQKSALEQATIQPISDQVESLAQEKSAPQEEAAVRSEAPQAASQLLAYNLTDDAIRLASQAPAELQAKKVREAIIDALTFWLDVPAAVVTDIKAVVAALHIAFNNDDSGLSNAALLRGLEAAGKLPARASISLCMSVLKDAANGQLYRWRWQRSAPAPSESEYLAMIDTTSGAALRVATKLLLAHNESLPSITETFADLITPLNRLFTHLTDLAQFKATKAGDLTAAAALSLPLVHTLNNAFINDEALRSAYDGSRGVRIGEVPLGQKMLLLKVMQPSVGYAMKTVDSLQGGLKSEIERLEVSLGRKNWPLRLMLQRTYM